MSEDLELQNQIAQLAGRINRHKTAETQPAYTAAPHYSYGNGNASHVATETKTMYWTGHHSGWAPHRGTPYGAPRGRGRGARAVPHRNRTLVLNSGASTPGSTGSQESQGTSGNALTDLSTTGWVTKRDRHMQLINSSVYERKTQERTEAIEATRQKKRVAQEEREKARVNSHFQSLHPQATRQSTDVAAPHHIYVHDIRFLVADGGSKLLKAPGRASTGKQH